MPAYVYVSNPSYIKQPFGSLHSLNLLYANMRICANAAMPKNAKMDSKPLPPLTSPSLARLVPWSMSSSERRRLARSPGAGWPSSMEKYFSHFGSNFSFLSVVVGFGLKEWIEANSS